MFADYSVIVSEVGAVSDQGRRSVLSTQENFEGLIKAGWDVLERDFDENTFLEWRKRAVEYLTEILGPEHYYTQRFGNKILQAETMGVLSGAGLLSAAREQMMSENCQLRNTSGV